MRNTIAVTTRNTATLLPAAVKNRAPEEKALTTVKKAARTPVTSAVPILNKIHPPLNDLFPTIDRLDLVIPRCQINLHRAAVCAARILGNDA